MVGVSSRSYVSWNRPMRTPRSIRTGWRPETPTRSPAPMSRSPSRNAGQPCRWRRPVGIHTFAAPANQSSSNASTGSSNPGRPPRRRHRHRRGPRPPPAPTPPPRGRSARSRGRPRTRSAAPSRRRRVRRGTRRRASAGPTSRAESNPLMTSISSAASATVRVIGPAWARVPNGLAGNTGTSPYVGFSATVPVKAAGIRTEPPPSVPTDHGPIPRPTAVALPPLDPPDVRSGFHGLPVEPWRRESVTPFHANSGVVVLPRSTAPVSRSRAEHGASTSHGPRLVDQPCAAQRGPALRVEDVLDRRGDPVAGAERLAAPPPLGRALGVLERGLVVDQHERIDILRRESRWRPARRGSPRPA